MPILRRIPDSSRAVECLWRSPRATFGYSSAVSLHSHTLHSREHLDFVPRVARKVPPAHFALRALERRHGRRSGKTIPYERAFWRPPLSPRAAWDLECRQITDLLNLRPLVSITDHDDLRAAAELRTLDVAAPYSLEWTVPFGATVFHLGVHNLPAERSAELAAEMARYTAAPTAARLAAVLAEIDAIESALVVFNHPLCAEERLARPAHRALVRDFLRLYGGRIHALELNGLQPASDNRAVLAMARGLGLPVVSGGDRHCLEPNANLNLTRAQSFDEFVDELRRDKISRVLFLPQYRESLAARYIEFIWQAVRDYPQQPGRERWSDRVYYASDAGVEVKLSALWPTGAPRFIGWFISMVRFLAAPGMRATLRLAFGEQGEIGA